MRGKSHSEQRLSNPRNTEPKLQSQLRAKAPRMFDSR